MEQELFRVEDKTAENDNAPIPLCKFCSKPMIRLPKTEKVRAGYACREADYYKLVENAFLKNMNSKNKTKKEKIASFKEVKNNKDMVDETKSLTEKYYFYPYIT